MRNKFLWALVCALITLGTMLLLDAANAPAQAHSKPACNPLQQQKCPDPRWTTAPAWTPPVKAGPRRHEVRDGWNNGRYEFGRGSTRMLGGYALQGAGTFVGAFCGKAPHIVVKGGCAVAVGGAFYKLREPFATARSKPGTCVSVSRSLNARQIPCIYYR